MGLRRNFTIGRLFHNCIFKVSFHLPLKHLVLSILRQDIGALSWSDMAIPFWVSYTTIKSSMDCLILKTWVYRVWFFSLTAHQSKSEVTPHLCKPSVRRESGLWDVEFFLFLYLIIDWRPFSDICRKLLHWEQLFELLIYRQWVRLLRHAIYVFLWNIPYTMWCIADIVAFLNETLVLSSYKLFFYSDRNFHY